MASNLRSTLRNWLNSSTDYNEGKNVVSKANTLYVASVKALIDEDRTVEIPVRGWSMRVFVEHERDKAILAPCQRETLRRGDVVLADAGGETYVLHRIIAIDGDNLTLMGDGNIAGTESCSRKDVVAIVTGFIRKGRHKPDMLTSRKWRIYSAIWVPCLPIRRYLLLAWRVLKRLHIVN